MKIFRWITDNILFVITLFLLIFIPLYPKLPLIDIRNTWVYIRAEDFVVLVSLFIWFVLLLKKKITLKTPLTLPIIIFWIIGGIATIHGVLLLFAVIQGAYSNVAFLSFLRRIEYLSVFFIAYAGIKDKQILTYVVGTLSLTLSGVILYGLGQRFYGFPAYLTMNEEFAKGTPVYLSPLSRIPSTFAGHYDLAAYLVLVIPIIASMIFVTKNWFARMFLLLSVFGGFGLLFMTVSRVSFFVLLLSLLVVFFFHNKRLVIFFLFSLLVASFIFIGFFPSLLARFQDTFKRVDVLVSAKTGDAIGSVRDVPPSYFGDRDIQVKFAQSKGEIDATETAKTASNSALSISSSSLTSPVPLVVETNASTGESLPQGTGYINLPLAPVIKRLGQFYYERASDKGFAAAQILNIRGDYLVKSAIAYDLSFTTRFQGEWPRAIDAFKRNIFLGSGYDSVGLAVDNNYFRILGEVGLLGFSAFFAIFLISVLYIKKVLPDIDSPVVKSFVLGVVAGIFGLALNATLIDVFEASKIAFLLWMLIGITIGMVHLYQKQDFNVAYELRKTMTSTYAIVIYLFIITIVLFFPLSGNFFVGDDFTWFRWATECAAATNHCPSAIERITSYFFNSNGFFYRPGTKVYFLFMYTVFWLNQTMYHLVSIFLHFIAAGLLFFIAKRIFKETLFSFLSACLFLILSGYLEAVFWISATGFLFNAVFILAALSFYIVWKEKKKGIYFILSFTFFLFSLLFHELGIIAPLFVVLYEYVQEEKFDLVNFLKKTTSWLLFLPIIPYLALRFIAQSHWFNGDYSYNTVKLPFNIVGNGIGYAGLDLFGTLFLSVYTPLRNYSKDHMLFSIVMFLFAIGIFVFLYREVIKKLVRDEQKIVIFGFGFFLIGLLPFLGLGNITSRYSYLSSIGFVILFTFFIKKMYNFLLINGKYIAVGATTVIVCLFAFAHLMQLQKIHGDWNSAGEKVTQFFISMDSLYNNDWSKQKMKFYFVNVPIKLGDAWVFPVGLSDAVWQVTHNENTAVYQLSSVSEAFSLSKGLPNEKIFEFTDDGGIVERKKTETSNGGKINP